MSVVVGEVTAVMGVEVTLRAYENSNLETHFYLGDRYKGISIREFISIEHGFREIICVVEGEYLDERFTENEGARVSYIRKLKARPIGHFQDGDFKEGIKYLPKIGDSANLLPDHKVGRIFERTANAQFSIGKLMKEEIEISLPWQKIFNSHLGIFGNTGSGKSNTLTKLYTVLFDNKYDHFNDKSTFVFLDFNGEYTGEQLVGVNKKKVLKLNTRTNDGDKFRLSESQFWDPETLGILFQATTNTQKPFLRRVVAERKKFQENADSLSAYLKFLLRRVLTSEDPNVEALELLKSLSKHLELSEGLVVALHSVGYMRKNPSFYYQDGANKRFFDADHDAYDQFFANLVNEITIAQIEGFDELQIRAELKLISDLLYGSVQYEHIRPLMNRLGSLKNIFSKVISVSDQEEDRDTVIVISLRECRSEVKKILPILIAKYYYEQHKEVVASPPETTMHLIVDEAHNILSQQSTREAESWKDYRLELFEEIIKEGRKFGVYITVASQRPADISPTIISQLHNYFIHRLVNDRDLALLENTITTLDSVSRSQIPNLPQGGCVVTGTTFDIPMLLQVDKLSEERSPDSSDVNLEKLWASD
ncbi:ATP-binding protein [Hoeflea prorocentri]|uniref:ATP-binding protein n=1 Tax=Hoeflea prorocentri TaxID=1922333 RepID=A0A9X3UJC8_9HYPH|nr:ATP-binding protein [Hoeflea prorocentri]MCY6382443.1 ATP-binding protein [Hoeflea prorocentri]MDA5400243.1 ATP-binding protein [Hoeflea prorocentri]